MTKRVTALADIDGTHASLGIWQLAIGAPVIKRIELVNFMSHVRTVIEPAAGLTVLVGPNNCGKSAFVSALQILCHNAKSNYVLRHGEKKCEITIETDDGHVVQWSRTRSGSPKYLIDDQEYDRLKQGTPPELHKILGLAKVDCDKDQFDVHFGEQKSPVFLLNDSGKASAQFFASSSDAIRLVEMQDLHKTKIREKKREQIRLSDEKVRVVESIENLKPIDALDQRLIDCENQFAAIGSAEEEIVQLEIMIRALGEFQGQVQECQAKVECLRQLAQPPEFSSTKSIEKLISRIDDLDKTCRHSSGLAGALSTLAAPPKIEQESGLEDLIGKIVQASEQSRLAVAKSRALGSLNPVPEMSDQQPLEACLKKFTNLKRTFASANKELRNLCAESANLETEIRGWVDANPECPTCGGATTVQQLIGSGGAHCHD